MTVFVIYHWDRCLILDFLRLVLNCPKSLSLIMGRLLVSTVSLTHLLETPILHGCCSEIYEIVGDIPSSDRASGIAHRSRDSYPRSEETKNVWLKGHTGVYYVVLFSDLSIF